MNRDLRYCTLCGKSRDFSLLVVVLSADIVVGSGFAGRFVIYRTCDCFFWMIGAGLQDFVGAGSI